MNKINHGTINLEQTLQLLQRKGMSPIANLLQCIYDNATHGTNHHVSFCVMNGSEWIKWREEKRVNGDNSDNEAYPKTVHDEYFGIRS